MLETAPILRPGAPPLLQTCAAETFARLMHGAFQQRFPAGVRLVSEGERCDFLHVLLEGAVELESAWRDHRSTFAVLRPPSTFALAAVVLDVPALMSAQTLSRSEVMMIPSLALRQAARTDGALACAIAEELAACECGVVRALQIQKLHSALERVANYLISQQHHQGGSAAFRLPYPKRLLASLLGMTPENLSRSFASLARYGVTVDGPRVTLGQPGALARLAGLQAPLGDPATRADRASMPGVGDRRGRAPAPRRAATRFPERKPKP